MNATAVQSEINSVRNSRIFAFSLTAICAAALLIRIWHLGSTSIWYDEGVTIGVAHFKWSEFFRFTTVEPNSILYYPIMRVFCLFGESEFFLRFTSVAFGTASIACFALFVRRIFNSTVALVTAVLLAFMPLHVVYSREIRGYALLLLLVTIAWLALERCLTDGRKRWFAIWAICWILAMYVHVFSTFALASQLCTLPFVPGHFIRKRRFLKTLAWIAAGYLPIVILVLGSHRQHLFWIPPLSPTLFGIFISEYLGGGRILIAASALLTAAGCALFISSLFHAERRSERWPWAVAVLGCLIPIALLAAVSVFQPAFIARYALQSQPAFALTIAAVLCRFPRTLAIAALAAVTLLYVPALISMDKTAPWEDRRNDYRAAVKHISAHARAADVIAVWGPYSRFSLEYYERRLGVSAFPKLVYPPPEANRADDTFALRPVVEQLDGISKNNRRIWFFLDESRPYQELGIYAHFFLRRFGMGHRLVSETHFRDATVYEFEAN